MLERLRNIGISAHIDAGKTTLAERMLYYCGRIHMMRDVRGSDGGATMDSGSIEKRRGITINSAATQLEWNQHRINLIDTPGHVDFTVEVERSLRVLDGAVLVVCAASGVQSQTVTVTRQMRRYNVPCIALINKMDLIGAQPAEAVQQLRDKLAWDAQPIQLPIGCGSSFVGVVDLIDQVAVYFDGEDGGQVRRGEVPDAMLREVSDARRELLEAVALHDEGIFAALSEQREPSAGDLRVAIRAATIAGRMVPVVFGSAQGNCGIQPVLDAVVDYLPSPKDRSVIASPRKDVDAQTQVVLTPDVDRPTVAMPFKTLVNKFGQLTCLRVYQGSLEAGEKYESALTGRKQRLGRLLRMHADTVEEIEAADAGDIVAVTGLDCVSGDTLLGENADCVLPGIQIAEPVMSLAVTPTRRDDLGRMAKGLDRLRREDPTLRISTDPRTGDTLVSGMGRLHLEVTLEKLRNDYDCPCDVGTPQVAYKQRPTRIVHFDWLRKKQNGGKGEHGHVIGYMEPLPPDSSDDFVFEQRVTGGSIPSEYFRSIEKGFSEQLRNGPDGEFQFVGIRVVLTDGGYHKKDSSDMAFRECAKEAMRECILPQADLVTLEPWMQMEVEIPEVFQGTVAAHLSKIRGAVEDSEVQGAECTIRAKAPLAELFNYADDLRTMTKGHGTFSMSFSGYMEATALA